MKFIQELLRPWMGSAVEPARRCHCGRLAVKPTPEESDRLKGTFYGELCLQCLSAALKATNANRQTKAKEAQALQDFHAARADQKKKQERAALAKAIVDEMEARGMR